MGRYAELKAKLDAGEELTAEEKAELDGLQADFDATLDDDAQVDKLADQFASRVTAQVEKSVGDIVAKLNPKSDDEGAEGQTSAPKMIVDKQLGSVKVEDLQKTMIDVPNREGKQHKQVSKFTSHFLAALLQNDRQKLQLLVEGTGARGGFLVPDDFANMIVEDIRDQSTMRQIADTMTTTSDTLHLPSLAGRPKASWRSEGAVKATSTVDFGENVFTPYSLAVIVGLSQELASDASLGVNGSIVNYIAGLMAQSLAEEENAAFWNGDGSGKPTGIDNYSLGTTTGATADALISAYFRLPQGYRNRATWVANGKTLEDVAKLKDLNNNYLLSNLAGAPTMTLKGRPVLEDNAIADRKIFFGDFGYYKIVDREGIEIRISDEATVAGQSAFERNEVFVRVEKRVDAELTLTSAIREVTFA